MRTLVGADQLAAEIDRRRARAPVADEDIAVRCRGGHGRSRVRGRGLTPETSSVPLLPVPLPTMTSSAASTSPPLVTFRVPVPELPTITSAVVPDCRRSAPAEFRFTVPVAPVLFPIVMNEPAVSRALVRVSVATSGVTLPEAHHVARRMACGHQRDVAGSIDVRVGRGNGAGKRHRVGPGHVERRGVGSCRNPRRIPVRGDRRAPADRGLPARD